MYGYTLDTGFYILPPLLSYQKEDNFTYSDIDSLRGVRMVISNTVAEVLNFSMNVKVINNRSQIFNKVLENEVDFAITPHRMFSSGSNKINFDLSAVVTSVANHILVRQQPPYRIEFKTDFLRVAGMFIGILIILLFFAYALNLNSKI